VIEDGVSQEVALFGHHDAPISVVVLFDKSGSMAGDKLMHAKDAIVNFVGALARQDETLVIAFSHELGQFGLDAKIIQRETKGLRSGGGTRLYDAVLEAAKAITTSGRKEKRAILILSDGEDAASRASLDDAVEAVTRAEVPVYAIGIEMEGEAPEWNARSLWKPLRWYGPVEALKRLTDGTGGWTYPIVAAKRCKEVCLLVADELRNQYLLGYYPTNEARDGRWRTLTVRTTRSGVTLAARAGYFAPTP
jgi:VWFA-related protein